MKYNWPVLLVLTLTPCLQQRHRGPGFIKGTRSFRATVAGGQAVLGPRLDRRRVLGSLGAGQQGAIQPGTTPPCQDPQAVVTCGPGEPGRLSGVGPGCPEAPGGEEIGTHS